MEVVRSKKQTGALEAACIMEIRHSGVHGALREDFVYRRLLLYTPLIYAWINCLKLETDGSMVEIAVAMCPPACIGAT